MKAFSFESQNIGAESMDPNLVEKITRLVIANLEEYASSHKVNAFQSSSVEKNPNYHPLSKAEIDDYKFYV